MSKRNVNHVKDLLDHEDRFFAELGAVPMVLNQPAYEQLRFPRTRKARILKKWARNPEYWGHSGRTYGEKHGIKTGTVAENALAALAISVAGYNLEGL